jgi:hypothetical protein
MWLARIASSPKRRHQVVSLARVWHGFGEVDADGNARVVGILHGHAMANEPTLHELDRPLSRRRRGPQTTPHRGPREPIRLETDGSLKLTPEAAAILARIIRARIESPPP